METTALAPDDLEIQPPWFSEVELRVDRWRDEHTRALVVRDGGNVVAAGIMWTSRVHGDRYWVSVVVDPDRRREGIGRRLVGDLARLRVEPLPLMMRGFVGTPELAFADALGARTIQVVPPMDVDVSRRDALREPTPQTASGAAVGIEALGVAWASAYAWTHGDWSPVAPDFAGPLLEGFEDEVDLEATSVALDSEGKLLALCVAFTDGETPVLCGETTVRHVSDGERLVESCLRRTLDVLAERGVNAVEMDGHVSDPHWLPAWIKLDPSGRWFRLVEIEPEGDAAAALGSAVEKETWQRIAHATGLREQRAQIAAIAERARTHPIPELPDNLYGDYERTGDRAAFEARYFERRRGLAALAIAALLEPGSGTERLAELIAAICDEPYWSVPAHLARDGLEPRETLDLFASETGSALAEITALLGPRLPADLVDRARAAVVARVIEPYERHTFWWEDSPNNWASVCAGSVALAAMQVCEPERVRALLRRLRGSLRRSLDGYGDDGVCVEGFGYWRYGFGYYMVATEALDACFGPEPEPDRAAEAARWPLRAFLSGRTLVSFADTWIEGTADAGLLAGADRRYGKVGVPAAELTDTEVIDECGRWALALRSLCWAVAADVAPAAGVDQPRWYADAQWLVVPEGAHSPIGFAARAGHNGDPHNHNDLGSVIVARAGQMLVADAGRGVYDRDYFGAHRYDNPAAGSQGHSVPMLDGVVQSEGASARAEVLRVELDGAGERLEVDLTSAYAHPGLVRLVRRVERRGEQVMVTDAMTATEPIVLTQRFVTLLEPHVAGGVVRVATDGATAELAHAPEATVTAGAFPVGRGSFPIPVHYVDITSPAATEVEHTVVVTTH